MVDFLEEQTFSILLKCKDLQHNDAHKLIHIPFYFENIRIGSIKSKSSCQGRVLHPVNLIYLFILLRQNSYFVSATFE